MRPSLEQVTSKPCLAPSSVTAVSQMLSLPSWRFTTACSKPEDLVKTRTDFFCAENRRRGRVRHAVAAVKFRPKNGRGYKRGTLKLNAHEFYIFRATQCILAPLAPRL